MVKKIKRIKKRARVVQGGSRNWLVPFNEEGQAAVYIHKHGDTDDHSACGPVVLCCERAASRYRAHAPDLHRTVASYRNQDGHHVCTWLDSGVGAIYFVLCDPDEHTAGYQFGLSSDDARDLLQGRVSHAQYRQEAQRFTVHNATT